MRPAILLFLLLPVLLTLPLASSATGQDVLPGALAFSRSAESGGGAFVRERSGRVRPVARGAFSPAWSPDGRRLAFVAPSQGSDDLFVADADGSNRARLTRTAGADEESPSWAPDGRRLVVERAEELVVVSADGSRARALTAGREPAWSPDGSSIAFVSDRSGAVDLYVVDATGKGLTRVTESAAEESEPAWSASGRYLSFVSLEAGTTDLYLLDLDRGKLARLTTDEALETSPAWTPDGRRIAFVGDRSGVPGLWAVPAAGGDATLLASPTSVDRFRWRPRVSKELLPDLEQRAPADLALVATEHGPHRGFLLGFTSATDNAGEGALSIVASRPNRSAPMAASQRVRLAGGGIRVYPRIGFLRYSYAPPHEHWHLLGFQRYELRRATDHSVVVRDRKAGFCLTDRWAHALPRLAARRGPPRFTSYCAQGNTQALSLSEGTSVGYVDRYPAWFHGQNLDLTHVPAGTYVLVHRANTRLALRELRYENNAASLRVRISWPRGHARLPAIRVLATCPSSEWCEAR